MPIVFDDQSTGASPIGTTPLTINAVNYYVDDFSWEFPVNVITQADGVGSPRRAAGVAGLLTGTFTLQLETTSSALPQQGTYFVVPAIYSPSGSNAFSASILNVTRGGSVGQYHTVNITAQKKLN